MDIQEITPSKHFCDYVKMMNFVREIRTYTFENLEELNKEFVSYAPIFKLSKEEYIIIINRLYHTSDDEVNCIKRYWKKDKKKGLFKLIEFCYVRNLKGGREFIKKLKRKLK
jgi:hypothetical protein